MARHKTYRKLHRGLSPSAFKLLFGICNEIIAVIIPENNHNKKIKEYPVFQRKSAGYSDIQEGKISGNIVEFLVKKGMILPTFTWSSLANRNVNQFASTKQGNDIVNEFLNAN